MKAKLVQEIPQREGLPWYFRKYEFECIDCGEHFFSGKCNKRTNPYCPACHRKYEREKQKYYQEKKKQRAINDVLDKIKTEILEIGGYKEYRSVAPIDRVEQILKIIDKYRQEG